MPAGVPPVQVTPTAPKRGRLSGAVSAASRVAPAPEADCGADRAADRAPASMPEKAVAVTRGGTGRGAAVAAAGDSSSGGRATATGVRVAAARQSEASRRTVMSLGPKAGRVELIGWAARST